MRPQVVKVASRVILALSSFETGQLDFARAASFSNFAWLAPGTFAFSDNAIVKQPA
jgi:hypothetical protein